jgi:hypothetical protein
VSDRNLDQLLDAWLDLGPDTAPDRVAAAASYEARSTRQAHTRSWWPFLSVPFETKGRRAEWPARRFPQMSTIVRAGLGAAAVLVIGILAVTFFSGGERVGDPSGATPEATPSPLATPIPFPEGRISTSGRYQVDIPHVSLDAVMTLGPGWSSGGWFVNSQRGAVALFVPANVNRDACDLEGTLPDPAIGPTVDDLVAALDAQVNSDLSGPEPVTIGDVSGQRIEMRASPGAPCDEVRWWKETAGLGEPDSRGATTGDENPDTIWVLDVDGQRIAVVGYWDHAVAANEPAVTEVVNSLEFTPRSP